MSKRPQIPFAPLLIGAAVLAAGYLGFTTTRYIVHEYQLRQEETALRQQIDELAREREQLIAVRDYLRSDEYVEQIARRVLGLVRPGETLVIVSGTEDASAADSAPSEDAGNREWWQELFLSDEPVSDSR